jgi:hypothetical protein
VDAAVGRAGAARHHRQRLGGQLVDPAVQRLRLAGDQIVAEPAPEAVAVDLLVRDRALDDEHERLQLAGGRLAERGQEVLAGLVGQHLVVEVHLGDPGDHAEDDVLDAGLGGGGDRHRVAVAAHSLGDPEDVQLLHAFALAVLGHDRSPFLFVPDRQQILGRGSA